MSKKHQKKHQIHKIVVLELKKALEKALHCYFQPFGLSKSIISQSMCLFTIFDEKAPESARFFEKHQKSTRFLTGKASDFYKKHQSFQNFAEKALEKSTRHQGIFFALGRSKSTRSSAFQHQMATLLLSILLSFLDPFFLSLADFSEYSIRHEYNNNIKFTALFDIDW